MQPVVASALRQQVISHRGTRRKSNSPCKLMRSSGKLMMERDKAETQSAATENSCRLKNGLQLQFFQKKALSGRKNRRRNSEKVACKSEMATVWFRGS